MQCYNYISPNYKESQVQQKIQLNQKDFSALILIDIEMQNKRYDVSPYSFSRQKNLQQQIYKQKFQNQPETNEHSDNSEVQQFKNGKPSSKNYKELAKVLTEQVEYHKDALRTAENLIANYQRQTNNLREENIQLTRQLNLVNIKLQNAQRLLQKVFECQQKYTQFQKRDQKTQKMQTNPFIPLQKQNLKTFYNNEDDQIYQNHLQNKIENIVNQQYRYEEQIFQLNKKIKHLQKFHQTNIKQNNRNKLKTIHYLPFTSMQGEGIEKQKITKQLVNIYGNEKTIKAITTKQTQFKKNLQKQFQVFLQSKRSTTKNKNSAMKSLCNKDSMISISASTQKKVKPRTMSVSKRM